MEGKAKSLCPSCGKTMILPDRILNPDKKDRKRIKEAIAREAEMKKKALGLGGFEFGKRRSGVIFAVLALSFAGVLLITQVRQPASTTATTRTKEMIAEQNLGILTIALNWFKADIGRYPTTEEGLRALINNPGIPNWPKSYVDLIRTDPWKQPYIYESFDDTNVLFSIGRDKIRGTADDIYPPPVTDPGRRWGAGFKEPDNPEAPQADTQ